MAGENKFESNITALLKGMNGFLSSKTVVGEPVKVGSTTLIPLIDVSFGMAAGSSNLDKSNRGSGGMGGKMNPCAVLVIQNGSVKLINVKNQDAITKTLDLIPDVLDRFTAGKKGGNDLDPEVEQAIKDTVEKETGSF